MGVRIDGRTYENTDEQLMDVLPRVIKWNFIFMWVTICRRKVTFQGPPNEAFEMLWLVGGLWRFVWFTYHVDHDSSEDCDVSYGSPISIMIRRMIVTFRVVHLPCRSWLVGWLWRFVWFTYHVDHDWSDDCDVSYGSPTMSIMIGRMIVTFRTVHLPCRSWLVGRMWRFVWFTYHVDHDWSDECDVSYGSPTMSIMIGRMIVTFRTVHLPCRSWLVGWLWRFVWFTYHVDHDWSDECDVSYGLPTMSIIIGRMIVTFRTVHLPCRSWLVGWLWRFVYSSPTMSIMIRRMIVTFRMVHLPCRSWFVGWLWRFVWFTYYVDHDWSDDCDVSYGSPTMSIMIGRMIVTFRMVHLYHVDHDWLDECDVSCGSPTMSIMIGRTNVTFRMVHLPCRSWLVGWLWRFVWFTYHVDHDSSDSLPRFDVHLIKHIATFVLEQFKGDGQMMILENRFVVVHQSQIWIWWRYKMNRIWVISAVVQLNEHLVNRSAVVGQRMAVELQRYMGFAVAANDNGGKMVVVEVLRQCSYQRWWMSEWVTPGGTAIPGMTNLKDGDLQYSSA